MSARQRTGSSKKDLSSAFQPKTCFACQAYPAQRLRAVAGSQDLGVLLAEYAASLRFQTSAPPNPGRAGREPRLTCQTSTSATLRERVQPRAMVEPVGIEPTT